MPICRLGVSFGGERQGVSYDLVLLKLLKYLNGPNLPLEVDYKCTTTEIDSFFQNYIKIKNKIK